MPKVGKSNQSSINPKKKLSQITCAACGETKKVSEYYVSYNPIHQTQRIPYCKSCLKNMICDENGNVQLERLKTTLQLIDRPFLYSVWKSALEDKMDTFGCYMKNLQMIQYRKLGYADSRFLPEVEKELNYDTAKMEGIENNEFIVTQEIMDKWGLGYKTEEYQAFEKKYNLLKNNYTEKTAMHTEALLNYIRYRVKEELSTAEGDVEAAKKWGSLAKDAATAAKINPSQLSKADLSDGLSTFSELSQAVEKAVDIIPILPRFKYRPNDALDFNIWCYVNYMRDLSGLPPCRYEDIYAFYDRRKEDYIKQYGDPYGIFKDEPTEKNRENIKNFIKKEGE
jgi:hypothetical protein